VKAGDCTVPYKVSSAGGGAIELSFSVSSAESMVPLATRDAAADGGETFPRGSSSGLAVILRLGELTGLDISASDGTVIYTQGARFRALHTTNAELLASTCWEKLPLAPLARDSVDAEVSYPL
jgi:hypothetical protein